MYVKLNYNTNNKRGYGIDRRVSNIQNRIKSVNGKYLTSRYYRTLRCDIGSTRDIMSYSWSNSKGGVSRYVDSRFTLRLCMLN